jgi:hypothetical protein
MHRCALLTCFFVILLLLASAIGTAAQTTNSAGTNVVALGPEKTKLIGRLVIETKFGPPNYGETPESDKKIRIYVLRLTLPITAKDMDGDGAKKGLDQIEVFFREKHGPNSWDAAHRAIGKCVSAVGEIEPSQLAIEFTALVMNVNKLIVLKPNECRQVAAKRD